MGKGREPSIGGSLPNSFYKLDYDKEVWKIWEMDVFGFIFKTTEPTLIRMAAGKAFAAFSYA